MADHLPGHGGSLAADVQPHRCYETYKLIVLDKRINSMTEFKQIIGRGTRINEDYNKFFFTIMDFDEPPRLTPAFDGDPFRSTSRARRIPGTAR